MKQYLDLLQDVLENGEDRTNRTGVDTRSLFGRTMRFNFEEGFPAVTTKKLAFSVVVKELLWFLTGSGNVRQLQAKGVKIWDADYERWAAEGKAKFDGDMGRVYGVQWRSWQAPSGEVIDQIKSVIERIKINPTDRRLIVSAWNVGELDQMALPPCHMMFHFYVSDDKLSLLMYQRSCDMFLGVPFNIASYSLLLAMVAQVTGLKAHEFVHILGDTHIYSNHFDAVKQQLDRTPIALPKLWLNPRIKNIDDFTEEDIKLIDYKHHEPIKAQLNVGFAQKKETTTQ